MGRPRDVDRMGDWEVYGEPRSWPRAPDSLFIVDATARISQAMLGLGAADFAHDPWTVGYRNLIASDLGDLLMSGSLLATVRRTQGSASAPVAPEEWNPTNAYQAISTGIVDRRHGRDKSVPHWVFVGEREIQVLEALYAATSMQYYREDFGPTELLGEMVLASVSAMARNPSAVARDAGATLRMLFPRSRWQPHPDDEATLVAAAVPWLLRAFDGDPKNRKDMDDFEADAIEAFSPIMTGRLFEKVWAEARTIVAPRSQEPKHPEHVHRFTTGPNKKVA